jgi:hypothetical protein
VFLSSEVSGNRHEAAKSRREAGLCRFIGVELSRVSVDRAGDLTAATHPM